MSEKQDSFTIDQELLDYYKITTFHLDLLRYSTTANCNEAISEWKDSWGSCPVCGACSDNEKHVVHKTPLKDCH